MLDRRQFIRLSFASLSAVSARAAARPKQIYLIRHAEKTGLKTDIHLNPRGYQRAAALPRLFPAHFEKPDFIIATAPSATSNRPIETVTPLAKALRLAIDKRFLNEAFPELAKELLSHARYAGKTVLVCWHHKNLPQFAKALGAENPPSPWPDEQFDRLWKIEYSNGAPRFSDLPQHLLEGDT